MHLDVIITPLKFPWYPAYNKAGRGPTLGRQRELTLQSAQFLQFLTYFQENCNLQEKAVFAVHVKIFTNSFLVSPYTPSSNSKNHFNFLSLIVQFNRSRSQFSTCSVAITHIHILCMYVCIYSYYKITMKLKFSESRNAHTQPIRCQCTNGY